MQNCLTSTARVFEVLDAPLEIQHPSEPGFRKKLRGSVRFDTVTFGHQLVDAVLHHVDFEVKPGQCVAILGATGAGKSTLMLLIPRFYDPSDADQPTHSNPRRSDP